MADELSKAVGNRIRTLRERSGATQEAFAARAGIDRAAYGKIERGERNLSVGMVARIASHLDVTLSDIFDGIAISPAK